MPFRRILPCAGPESPSFGKESFNPNGDGGTTGIDLSH
jgi:hypothetical protein